MSDRVCGGDRPVWPGLQIMYVDPGSRAVFAAEIVACFYNPDSIEGDWFNCKTGYYNPFGSALRTCDEGTTWSRDASPEGQAALLAAFKLEQSAA